MNHDMLTLGAYFIFSAIVSGMPDPTPTSPLVYKWAYHSLHILAGDLSHIIGSRQPQPK